MKTLVLLSSLLGLPCMAADSIHVTIAGRDVAVWKPARPAPPQGNNIVDTSFRCLTLEVG